MHSTFATQSFAFVLIHQSLPSLIAKLSTRCLALHWVWMSGMFPLVSASTTSVSHGSSANSWHSLVCSAVSVISAICIMSLTMPDVASQSGQTNQLAPSLLWPGPLVSDHFRLMASATTFMTPGRCLMSMMFRQTIDSSHLACVELCFLLSRTSHSTWQSVSISIGDPYIIELKSSNANFSAANSSMNGSYFSSLGEVRLEQNASGCHLLCCFPWSSVVLNSWHSILPKPFLLPSVTILKTCPLYSGAFRTGSEVTVTFRVRKAFFCSLPHLVRMDVACKARLYAPFHAFHLAH